MTKKESVNGWYYIIDVEAGIYDPVPIATVGDFESLRFDSAPDGDHHLVYIITGKLKCAKKEALKKYKEGKTDQKIGFVYDGVIIYTLTADKVLKSGNFAIISYGLKQNKKSIYNLYENLKKEMD